MSPIDETYTNREKFDVLYFCQEVCICLSIEALSERQGRDQAFARIRATMNITFLQRIEGKGICQTNSNSVVFCLSPMRQRRLRCLCSIQALRHASPGRLHRSRCNSDSAIH